MPPLTPKLPFLLPALIAWIEDNGCTPMLVSKVDVPGVWVPDGYAKDGMITFNISAQAVQGLVIDEESVSFGARFGGRHFDIRLSLASLQAIFAREYPEASGMSLVGEARLCAQAANLDREQTQQDAPARKPAKKPAKKKGPPKLRLVD